MDREVFVQQFVRSLTRDATIFIVALLLFVGSMAFWQVAAPFFGFLLLIGFVRACLNFRRSFNQNYAGISKWPPLSREDRRVAQSKLKTKPEKSSRRCF
jgi:asparagine N-glycosylation enzyme membrane subunit Stt3